MKLTPLYVLVMVAAIAAIPKKTSVTGKIMTVDENYCGKSVDYVIHAMLAVSGKDPLNLVLAPQWYLHTKHIELKLATELTATILPQADGSALVVQLTIAGKTHSLRDAKGRPLWKAEPGSEDLFKTICRAPGSKNG